MRGTNPAYMIMYGLVHPFCLVAMPPFFWCWRAKLPELHDRKDYRTPLHFKAKPVVSGRFSFESSHSGGDYIAPKGLGSNDKQGAPRRAVASGLVSRLTGGGFHQ